MNIPFSKPTVLLVDDDPRALLATEGFLLSDAYEIVTARSGAEALLHLRETREFALVLLDVRMPVIDGFAVARVMKAEERLALIPICFMTAALKDQADILSGYAVGAVDLLIKPVDPYLLRAKVAVFVKLWRTTRDLATRTTELVLSNQNLLLLNNELCRRADEVRVAHQALRESEEQLRLTFDVAPVGMLEVDEVGIIILANTQMELLFGYTRGELAGLKIERVLPEWFRAAQGGLRQGVIADPHARRMGAGRELFGRRKDGTEFPVDVGLSPLATTQGIRVVAPVVDITERKAADTLQRQYEAQLEASNAELEHFAASASHDLREPLRKIQTFSHDLLTRLGPGLDEESRSDLQRMQAAVGRMNNFIHDLLAYSLLSRTHAPPQPVDLGALLHDVLADLDVKLMQLGGTVEVGPLPTVAGVPVRLRQLLHNLVANSLKYHRPGTPPRIVVRASKTAAGWHELRVEDNGLGFDQKHAERIFVLFERLHGWAQHEGTGIGLATCRKIIEQHGGTIRAEGRPKEGATFILTFPALSPSV